MAQTRFTGPVVSDNGFVGSITLTDIVGDTLEVSGTSTLTGAVSAPGGVTGATTGAHNGTVGAGTPNTGAFTTLTASGAATFSNASVKMTALPTADPVVAGALWNDAGTLKVSAGA